MLTEENYKTGRYWTRAWSLVENCTRCSEGCCSCWLLDINHRFRREGPVRFMENRLHMPLRAKKPSVWAVWSDLFHESVPEECILDSFTVMAQTERHTFLVLTKRPERMTEMAERFPGLTDWPNVWLVTSCETQEWADKRIPELLQVPGHKGLSLEPLLSDINFHRHIVSPCVRECPEENKCESCDPGFRRMFEHPLVDFVVVGPETGPKRRECKPEWIRNIIEQCDAAGIKVWVKAFPVSLCGDCEPGEGCRECDGTKGKTRIAYNMDAWPAWARRREVPRV